MRAIIRKSGNSKRVYIQKSFRNVNGKNTSKIVESLGDIEELKKKLKMSEEEVLSWAQKKADDIDSKEKDNSSNIVVCLSQNKLIDSNNTRLYKAGYLFIQKMYYQMNMDNVFRNIRNRNEYEYDLNAIFSDLVFTRLIEPSSKYSSYEIAKSFLEPPKYKLHDIYRGLSILAKESDYIQAEIYKNSNHLIKRNSKILYYDCSNYFFEVEQEDIDGLRKYGKSKEHRPSPIVQMGLFIDSNGIPLAFNIFEGNKNEQLSLTPLETTIIRDFDMNSIVVCTDAGLSGYTNKLFNNTKTKAYITTQSLKKLKKLDQDWALDKTKDWNRLSDDIEVEDISNIKDNDTNIYYKEEPYPHKEIKNQRLIISYSHKYAIYQSKIRQAQIQRAIKLIEKGENRKTNNLNDPRRFIKKTSTTSNGEIADEVTLSLDENLINEEAKYDGYYGIVTNLEDEAKDIIKVASGRWEIEECFRIMKTDFKARPVYLQRDDRIKAHFLTCFVALFFLRVLEYKTKHKYTTNELLDTLRSYNLTKINEGYIPSYTRDTITDDLHSIFGFRTDYEITSPKKMRNIIKISKK